MFPNRPYGAGDESFPLVPVVCPRCGRKAKAHEWRTEPGVLFQYRQHCLACVNDGTRVAMVKVAKKVG